MDSVRRAVLIFGVLALVLGAVAPARAFDEDIPLAMLPRQSGTIEDAEAKSFQIYRISISYRPRKLKDKPWGLRLYFPISLGTFQLETATNVGDFFDSFQSIAFIPGAEFLVPVGDRWVLKPFVELGVADDTATGGVELLYAAGIRARGEYQPGPFDVMVGGALRYRNNTTSVAVKNWYSTVEIGADAQLPLGFSVGSKEAHGGMYAVARHYSNLEFELITEGPINIEWNYEVGLSFATDPIVKLWKIKMPWIALGYRFGDRQSGYRLSFNFPF